MEKILDLQKVSKIYNSEVVAVNQLNLSIRPGQVIGLLGPNGSGKTTTINMIIGLQKPSSGAIYISGYDITMNPEKAKAFLGYVPDKNDVVKYLTGMEYVCLVQSLYYQNILTKEDQLNRWFKLLNLENFQHSYISTYSHGMYKKTQMIAALAHEPQLLIFDEPTSGLDVESITLLKKIIAAIKDKNRAVLIATHNLPFATEVCDYIYLINKGNCLAQGSVSDILQEQKVNNLEDAFIKYVIPELNTKEISNVIEGLV